MRCPSCGSSTPSGRPTCARCGALLTTDPASRRFPAQGGAPPVAPDETTAPAGGVTSAPAHGASTPPAQGGTTAPGPGGTTPPGADGTVPVAQDRVTARLPDTANRPAGDEPAPVPVTSWGTPPVFEDAYTRRRAPGRWFGRRARALWASLAVALVLLGAGAAILLLPDSRPAGPRRAAISPSNAMRPSSGGVPSQSEDAPSPAGGTDAAQASAVNALLAEHLQSGNRLSGDLTTCDEVAASAPEFEQFIRTRQQQLTQARTLQVDRLPAGEDLRQALIDAYQYSLDADRAYLAWAHEVEARDCGSGNAPQTGSFHDAMAANDKAGPAKRHLVALWNPIAVEYGLPTYVWQDV